MPSTSCPHPAEEQILLFPASDYITGDRFTIERCTRCGLARTMPIPSDLERYYPAGYYGTGKRYPALLEALLDRLYAARVRHLERFVDLSGRPGPPAGGGPARGPAPTESMPMGFALDIGCGRGQILDQLRLRGWRVIGTEISEESARYAREVLDLDVRVGELRDLNLPAGSFDLITLWHVLEHMPEPASLLADVVRLLRPSGALLVAVPNFGSPEARWGRDRWFHLDVPRHLAHLDQPTLRRLLEGAGLQPIRTTYFAPEYDLFSAVQTALNRLGIRHNLLYNLLRTRGARPLGERFDLVGTAATLLLLPALTVLSAFWIFFAALTRRGATVSILARKCG